MTIVRNPERASQKHYDVVVVGGGIYGAMLALEASLCELSVLVLEKEDFGGATSYNSLRIVHGGLRDLQSFNLKRYWEFGRERRWFLEHFPELVEPLPVLVPLYQRGLLRTDLFRGAFLIDRWLLPQRDRTIAGDDLLPCGEVVTPSEVTAHFPQVDMHRLRGGALWYDAAVPDSQRLLVEVLRCACHMGTTALNYTEAVQLLTEGHRVVGVRGHDVLRNAHHDFSSNVVVNATGPWSGETARRFGHELPGRYYPSLAWNVLFDCEAPSDCALGVMPPAPGGQMYFLHPWKGRLLAGTGHAPREERRDPPRPTADELHGFLADLNAAVPTLKLSRKDMLHVFAGYLPVAENNSVQLIKHDEVVNHAEHGGPRGLLSIVSTKLTAARSTAEQVLTHVFPDCTVTRAAKEAFHTIRAEHSTGGGVFAYHWYPGENDTAWRHRLRRIIREESVCHLDDLVLRRTSLGDNPVRALELAPELCTLFDWEDRRSQEEIRRLEDHFCWVEHASVR